MRIRVDALDDDTKRYYWVIERWPGFSPALTYTEQLQALRRYQDAISNAESGWESGKVVMMFHLADKGGFVQLVAADSSEDFASYLKQNEVLAALPPDCLQVMNMVHWNTGKDAFLQMIARLNVRATAEREGQPQPAGAELQARATALRVGGALDALFRRLDA